MGRAVDLRSVRERCERVLAEITLPKPFGVQAFGDAVAAKRGRELHLLAKATAAGPCGVWLALPDADYVFYEPATSALHRDHIVLHELGHLLCDHGAADVVEEGVLRQLLPNLDLAMVHRVLGRTAYSAVEEQEAEMIATLVLQRAATPAPPGPDASGPAVIGRLHTTLGGEGHERR